MEYRYLGKTGVRVSALSLGTMTFGGVEEPFLSIGQTEAEEARELVSVAIDAGVNLFDTADMYSRGRSEEILGKALGRRRDSVLVATKLHQPMSDDPNDLGLSRHHIVAACEASLRRLGTDHIDLYQVHGFDGMTDVEQSLRALDDLVRSGKVRYVGCSNFSAWHLMKSLGISERLGIERYVALQAAYSLVSRELELELVPLCLDQGIGILVWGPLAEGLLSGKVPRGEERAGDSRIGRLGVSRPVDEDFAFGVVDVVREIAAARGVTPAEVALNWVRRRRGVASVIIGARTRDQLEANLRAAEWDLTPEEAARLSEVSERPLPYPYWHQVKHNAVRLHELDRRDEP